jgi:DNA-directed RNA polymerase subunit RPC12/RpoP
MERPEDPSAGPNSKAPAQHSESGLSSTPRLYRSVDEFVGEQPTASDEAMPTVIWLTVQHACGGEYATIEGEGSIECPGCGRRFAAQQEVADPSRIPAMEERDPIPSQPVSSRTGEVLRPLTMWEWEGQFPSRERRPTLIR